MYLWNQRIINEKNIYIYDGECSEIVVEDGKLKAVKTADGKTFFTKSVLPAINSILFEKVNLYFTFKDYKTILLEEYTRGHKKKIN